MRLLFSRRPGAASWLLALTLVLRVLVPTGYMPVAAAGAISIVPCSGHQTTAAMPGMAGHQDHGGQHRAEMPCAFAALSSASVAEADAMPAAPPTRFAAATRPIRHDAVPVLRPAVLRPPPRGPPATT